MILLCKCFITNSSNHLWTNSYVYVKTRTKLHRHHQ